MEDEKRMWHCNYTFRYASTFESNNTILTPNNIFVWSVIAIKNYNVNLPAMDRVYLSTAYFPPIQYFAKLIQYPIAAIEVYENFPKQTFRNRCHILGSNGKIVLSIPVKKSNRKTPIAEVEIDYSEDWQKQHRRALLAAYGSSPFYEYYINDFDFVFEGKTQMLCELNRRILNVCCELLQITPKLSNTQNFNKYYPNDFRNTIHPKSKYQQIDTDFRPLPYTQVFSDKFAFEPNLSILDLLFNLGTESEIYLLNTIKQS